MKQSWKKFSLILLFVFLTLYGVQFLLIPFVQSESEVTKKFDPTKSDDPFILGQYYFNHDDDTAGPYDLQKARFYFEQVIASNPESNGFAWYQLGRIDFLEGDYASALYKFQKQQLYFGDTVPNVHYMIGLTYGYRASELGSVEDWLAAEAAFLTYLTFDPWSPWARTDLAWIYFAQGKYRDMLPIVYAGLEHHPDHPWLLNMYGLALHNIGETDLATEYFDQAHEKMQTLEVSDWGRAYPGNNPRHWSLGLDEFKSVVEANQLLMQQTVDKVN